MVEIGPETVSCLVIASSLQMSFEVKNFELLYEVYPTKLTHHPTANWSHAESIYPKMDLSTPFEIEVEFG